MKCEIHDIEMVYMGEGSYIGQELWECYLCEAEQSDLLEAGYLSGDFDPDFDPVWFEVSSDDENDGILS